MIALPIHRDGIHFSKHYDCAFVHKDHAIVALWIEWRTDTDIAHSLIDDVHLKFTKKAAETLCLYFALPSLIRLQRWFRATNSLHRRLAVAMALHPRLGPAGVCRLARLDEDLLIKILSIA
jgi:hypothetical protein